jgi:hypothetical protein
VEVGRFQRAVHQSPIAVLQDLAKVAGYLDRQSQKAAAQGLNLGQMQLMGHQPIKRLLKDLQIRLLQKNILICRILTRSKFQVRILTLTSKN